MKKFIENMKDPITDVIGLVIMVFTLIEKHNGTITWLWEGIAGIGVGFGLFMMPDQWIKDLLQRVSDYFLGKKKDDGGN